jgi:hypothetical protein
MNKTKNEPNDELRIGKDVLLHAIQIIEEKLGYKLPRNESLKCYDDWELAHEVEFLFGTNGRNGYSGTVPGGPRWNVGISKSDKTDEDGDVICEPIFGFFRDAIHGATIWQGDYLIERVREALQTA